jgi:predicted metal-dependent hydrolase
VPTPPILIREQGRRWASCSQSGTVRFNWRIIQTPMCLVDYIVAHELVHLIHRNHTKDFWAVLGRVFPDADRCRTELRVRGWEVGW